MAPRVRVFLIAAAASFVHILSACQPESEQPSAARKAFDELQQKYDELVEDKLEDPVQWATDDIENLGDWDYRVENLSYSSAEELAAQLNEFGNDRWEVIWLERTPDGFLAVLKKPSVSYLSKIPLSGLGKIVIGGSDGEE
ncbi:MAG: hypothetical protein ACR2RD_18790 [Woeseiaceae bacterium]